MKRIKYIIFTFLVIFMGYTIVNAAPTSSFYVSSSTVENGKTVTASVTLKNVAAWNVKIISSGNTNGCSQSFADATSNGGNTTKTLSVTCKATSLGAIGFTLTGDVTSSDGANISISGSKRVTVVEPRPLSQNNYLASITVEGFEITPQFNEEVYEYSVTVPNTVNEINIDSKVKDKYASVSGNGTFEVTEGNNTFKLTVTAENGTTREYTVNVIVEDLNPIIIEAEGEKYTIIKNIKNIEVPELFTASTIKINDTEVPSFISDATDFVLLPVKDSDGKVVFVIINEDSSYTLYRTKKISNILFYFMKEDKTFANFESAELEFEEFKINALRSTTDSDYYLIYGRNMVSGYTGWYKYDSKESTLQRYEDSREVELEAKINEYLLVIFVFGIGLFLAIIIAIVSIIYFSKKRKKLVIDYQSKLKNIEIKQNEDKKDVPDKKELKENVKKSKKNNKIKKDNDEKNKENLEKTKEFNKDLVEESENSGLLADTVEIDKKDLKEIENKGSKKK